jgi:thymidylate synthase
MCEGFPLLTTKKIHFASVANELLWFLRGLTNVNWLKERGCNIWNEWADEDGELGPVYGQQWRNWKSWNPGDLPYDKGSRQYTDQLANLVHDLRENPDSRRMIVNAWNAPDIPDMKLPPCHPWWQVQTVKDDDGPRTMNLHMVMRSTDIFLGLPFNIASYGLLLQLLCEEVGMFPGELIISLGDLHLYNNHVEQAKTQLEREARPLPSIEISSIAKTITYAGDGDTEVAYSSDNFELVDYNAHPAISASVSV